MIESSIYLLLQNVEIIFLYYTPFNQEKLNCSSTIFIISDYSILSSYPLKLRVRFYLFITSESVRRDNTFNVVKFSNMQDRSEIRLKRL